MAQKFFEILNNYYMSGIIYLVYKIIILSTLKICPDKLRNLKPK